MTMSYAEMEELGYQRATREYFIIEQFEGASEMYNVFNPETGGDYIVRRQGNMVLSCTCPHFTYRDVACKHQIAVALKYHLKW